MEKFKKIISTFLTILLRSFVNPVGLVTVFGPIIVLKINSLAMKEELRDINDNSFQGLKTLVLDNEWTEVYADFNIQCIIIIVAFIFTIVEIFSSSYKLLINQKLSDISKKFEKDVLFKFFGFCTMAFILFGIFFFISGGLATVDNVILFKENALRYSGWPFHPPPVKFIIIRGLIALYSGFFFYIMSKKFSNG